MVDSRWVEPWIADRIVSMKLNMRFILTGIVRNYIFGFHAEVILVESCEAWSPLTLRRTTL